MESRIKMKPVETAPRIEKERSEFRNLLLENLNYFGTFPEDGTEAVKPMSSNTKYEELKCVGFYPEEDLLEAIIDVKEPSAGYYKGTLCSAGSYEYVRFYVDWGTGFEDVGIGSVNVHDIPDGDYVCVEKAKPLSYAITLKLNSKKRPCTSPNLVKVRAILSWDIAPPAGNPDWQPVYGNVVNKWIQIAPRALLVPDIIEIADLKKLGLPSAMLNLDSAISKAKPLEIEDLKELYKNEDVPEHRYGFVRIYQIAKKLQQKPILMAQYETNAELKKSLESIKAVLELKLNTHYEHLDCIGLNYDLDTLVATINIKGSSGFGGGLCTAGSYEYVAFWAYVWDQIENVCGWRYLGTSKVNVHDVKNTEGLQYAVYLRHDFSSYKDNCAKPKIMKIRAILSKDIPPPPNNPNYNPAFGNTVDAIIQLKPQPRSNGENKAFITSIGDMSLDKISGNVTSGYTSPLGDGYATGPAVVSGFEADDSPFGGRITVCGYITNPPSSGTKLRYKVQQKKKKETVWKDITNDFWITLEKNGVFQPQHQVATNGYFDYWNGYDGWNVLSDVLAKWRSKVEDSDGLHGDGETEIKVVVENGVESDEAWIMVDNTEPDPDITIDFTSDSPYFDDQIAPTTKKAPCGKVVTGKYIIGRFQAKDTIARGNQHYWKFIISVYPSKIKVGNNWISTPQNFSTKPNNFNPAPPKQPNVQAMYGIISTQGIALPPPPSASLPHYSTPLPKGVWQLNTTGMLPCGYVVILTVYDRTIVNSGYIGQWKTASVGFCLES